MLSPAHAATAASYASQSRAPISGPGLVEHRRAPAALDHDRGRAQLAAAWHGPQRDPLARDHPRARAPRLARHEADEHRRPPRQRAARATLNPLPPGVTTTRSKRSTAPGRSSSSAAVRSIVRFGPATSTRRRHTMPGPMKQYRLNRLFHPRSGRCFDVAVDHGFPGEPGFLAGIEDMDAAIDTLVDAAPDAIQLTRRPGRPAAAPARAATSRRSCCAPTRQHLRRRSRPTRLDRA